MASYIRNLVNRTNLQAGVVRSRPASLFEPATPVDLSSWATAWEQTALHPSAVPGADNLPSETDLPGSGSIAQPFAGQWAASQSAELAEQVGKERQNKPAQLLPRPETRLSRQAEEKSTLQSEKPGFFALADYLKQQLSLPQDHPGPDPMPARELQIRSRPHLSSPNAQGQSTDASFDQPNGFNHQAAEERLPSKPGPGLPNSILNQAQQSRIKETPPAETVINVTIGRVEVIATSTASYPNKLQPSPKQAGQSTVMSLDEYLKSREQEEKI